MQFFYITDLLAHNYPFTGGMANVNAFIFVWINEGNG
ncbi:hypothetical protein BH10BAC3_BH10BAC3_23570 [soil metagenome]